MAEISVGAAVAAGFSLIGRKPGAVLLWGLVRVVFAAGVLAIYFPVYVQMLAMISHAAQTGGAPPDAALTGFAPQMFMMQMLGYLAQLLALALAAVLYCAVYRAVLHPDQDRFAYLRVGPPEFFIMALMFGAGIAFGFGILIVILPIAVIVGILVAVHAVAAAVIVGVLAVIALIVALIYLGVRFSLVGPMIVADGKFHLFESWTLTRGHAGSLFLIGLTLTGLLLAAQIVLAIVVLMVVIAVLAVQGLSLATIPAVFSQPPGQVMAQIAPFLAVYALVAIPLTGCYLAIVTAPWAKAYRDLAAPDASEAFA